MRVLNTLQGDGVTNSAAHYVQFDPSIAGIISATDVQAAIDLLAAGGATGGAAAGSDTWVQFNDGGLFGASQDFAFDKNAPSLTLGGSVGSAAIGSYSTAFGSGPTAEGFAAHAEGDRCDASGDQAHAEGQQCVASDANTHAEGQQCTASAPQSHAEGELTAASGTAAHSEGINTIASGSAAHAEGSGTTASGDNSHSQGANALASVYSQHAASDGGFGTIGDGQYSTVSLSGVSSSGTPVILLIGGSDRLTVRTNFTYGFTARITGRKTTGAKHARYTCSGIISNEAGTTALVGAVSVVADDGSEGTWSVAVTADDTNDALQIAVTGEATVRWLARVELEEVGS